MSRIRVQAFVFTVMMCGTAASSRAGDQFVPIDLQNARKLILARFEAMQNLSVSYRLETGHPAPLEPPPGAPPPPLQVINGVQGALGGGEDQVAEEKLSRLGPQVRWDAEFVDDNGKPLRREIRSFSLDDAESFAEDIPKGRRGGAIKEKPEFTTFVVEPALAMRGFGQMDLLTAEMIGAMEISQEKDRVILSRKEVNGHGQPEEWEFRPDLGYAVSSYRRRSPPDNGVNIEVTPDNFKSVKGMMLPFSVKVRVMSHAGGQPGAERRVTQSQTATIKEYKLDDPENNAERYHIKWPGGTPVVDWRLGTRYVADVDGELVGAGGPRVPGAVRIPPATRP